MIDLAVLNELRDATGDEFLAELVTTFLEEAPGMMTELRQSAADQDTDAFRRAAHSIKSNASTFGVTALAASAKDMELGGIPDATALDALDDLMAQAATALKAQING